jgi:hypothetical protein
MKTPRSDETLYPIVHQVERPFYSTSIARLPFLQLCTCIIFMWALVRLCISDPDGLLLYVSKLSYFCLSSRLGYIWIEDIEGSFVLGLNHSCT